MTREIKFRAKRLDNNQLVIGYYLPTQYGEKHFIYFALEFLNEHTRIEIDPKTLGQYTGIKDKNGKEIYEGDIVSIEHIYYEGIAQYDSRLKESFKEIGNYVCKYDEGRFVFGNGYTNLEIHNFWHWNQEKEFYYAIGDFVKKNDRFGYFSKEYFRFLALEGNKFENPELLKGEKND